MELTSEDVLEIMKILENSNFGELRLEMKGLKLVVGRGGKPAFPGKDSRPADTPGVSGEPPGGNKTAGANVGKEISSPLPPPRVAEGLSEDNYLPIKAPVLGTFYATPKPGAPPFVRLGQLVAEDDVVCLIEVMKLFNTVKAGIRGQIVKICVEQAQMVEFQQTLFLVEKVSEGLKNE